MRIYLITLMLSILSGCATIDLSLTANEINNINFLSTHLYK